jgi:outer membrane protein assembly factor BamB
MQRKKCVFVAVLLFLLLLFLPTGFFSSFKPMKASSEISTCDVKLTSSDASPDIDWWPMFQHDVAHTGYSSANAPDTGETRFIVNYTESHETYASPIIVADRLIIPGGYYSNFSIYCVNATSGRFLWGASESFFSDATPAAYANRIVIPSSSAPEGGHLYCFDGDNGTLVWKFYFTEGGYGNLPSPIIHDGVVFFSSGTTGVSQQRGSMFALSLFDMENATTPKTIWKKSLNSIVTTSPAYSNGRILVGYTTYGESPSYEGDSYIASLNATDGSLVWSYLVEKVYYDLRSSPTVVDGKVFFGSYGIVYCLNESSGELLWKTELANTDIYASPAVAYGRLYVGTLSFKGSPDIPAVFACLNSSTGEIIWKHQLQMYPDDESPASSPAVADGKVFVCAGHHIYAFNETDGNVVWSFETTDYSGGCSPAVALDSVYVLDQDGYVYCFGPTLAHVRTGDVNQDGTVDISDAILAASAFGTYPGHPKWDSKADLNQDDAVDIFDLIILVSNFGKNYS